MIYVFRSYSSSPDVTAKRKRKIIIFLLVGNKKWCGGAYCLLPTYGLQNPSIHWTAIKFNNDRYSVTYFYSLSLFARIITIGDLILLLLFFPLNIVCCRERIYVWYASRAARCTLRAKCNQFRCANCLCTNSSVCQRGNGFSAQLRAVSIAHATSDLQKKLWFECKRPTSFSVSIKNAVGNGRTFGWCTALACEQLKNWKMCAGVGRRMADAKW